MNTNTAVTFLGVMMKMKMELILHSALKNNGKNSAKTKAKYIPSPFQKEKNIYIKNTTKGQIMYKSTTF